MRCELRQAGDKCRALLFDKVFEERVPACLKTQRCVGLIIEVLKLQHVIVVYFHVFVIPRRQ